MGMPGRKFSAAIGYRYGYNGKENDNEVKGDGNQQDYGMRIYDPRLGRFLSEDPLARDFPYYSSYHFAGCSPIKFIDIDGEEPLDYVDKFTPRPIGYSKTGQIVKGASLDHSTINVEDPHLGWISVQLIYDRVSDQNWYIHHNNNGKTYYYKRDDGQHHKLLVQIPKNSLPIVTGGHFEEYETENARQARIAAESADFLATFFAVTIGGSLVTGGGFFYHAGMALLEDAAGIPIINSPDDIARSSSPDDVTHNAADGLKLKKKLASEQQMLEPGEVIAGGSHVTPLRKADELAKQFGGEPTDWVKKRSSSYTADDGAQFETHWEENIKTGQRVNMKTTEIKTVSTQSPEANPTKRPYGN